jgi:hypothetical protein
MFNMLEAVVETVNNLQLQIDNVNKDTDTLRNESKH